MFPGLDIGKMLSGEGGGGMGASIMGMVTKQLAAPETQKMLTNKISEMTQHLADTLSREDAEKIKKEYEGKTSEEEIVEMNSKIAESTYSKMDISLLAKLESITVKNDKGEVVLVDGKDGSMIEQKQEQTYIYILARGKAKQKFSLSSFLSMMTQGDGQ